MPESERYDHIDLTKATWVNIPMSPWDYCDVYGFAKCSICDQYMLTSDWAYRSVGTLRTYWLHIGCHDEWWAWFRHQYQGEWPSR